jgi:Kef-type K+ transport system membrane component KefB
MPFLLLIFGISLGGYALYKFLRRSTKDEAQKLLLSLAIGLCLLLIFVMILVGKLPIAAILAAVLIPLISKLHSVLNKK